LKSKGKVFYGKSANNILKNIFTDYDYLVVKIDSLKNTTTNEENKSSSVFNFLHETQFFESELKNQYKYLSRELENLGSNPNNFYLCYIHSKQFNYVIQSFMNEISLKNFEFADKNLRTKC